MKTRWSQHRVRDLGEVLGGKQKVLADSPGVMRKYLRVANVFDGRIDFSDVLEMPFTEAEFEVLALQEGDVLLNEGQSLELVGRAARYVGQPGRYAIQNSLIRFRPGPKCDSGFAEVLFRHLQQSGAFMAVASRTTSIAHLGISRFANILVPMPPVEIQRKIASLAECFEQRITRLVDLITAKRRLKRALMQRLLRSDGIHAPERARDWKRIALGEVLTEVRVRNAPNHALPVVTVGKHAIRRQDEHFSRSVASADRSAYWVIQPGDFVYDPMSAYYGVFGRYELGTAGLVSPAYRVLRANGVVADEFLKWVVVSHRLRFELTARSSQNNKEGKRRLLSREAFDRICFDYPAERTAQLGIARALDTAAQSERALEGLLSALRLQKRGIMQRLLSGEVELPVARGQATSETEES